MRAAIYARYSSDKQREASIEDQGRNAERYAEREGWNITTRYADRAISGSVKDRPDYQRMLKDAEAHAFDVLLADDLSRLSRDDVEMKQVVRRFRFWGVRIVGISDGFDSDSKGHKVHAGVRGLINEIYLDDLRDKTHRGLTGQALKGNNCGGKSYGYHHVPIEDPSQTDQYGRPVVVAVRRAPDPEQAKWVRQIFQWYAQGHAPRWIAGELTRLGVPSPGATWKRSKATDGKWRASAIHGDMTKGTGILNNPLYIGRHIWNRSTWVKDPDTGKKHRRERPEAEWIVQDMPELRLVEQRVWDAVRGRQRELAEKNVAIRQALHENARYSPRPKHLFSGLLKCSECGSNFVMANATRYACATHTNGGKHACGNRLRVSRKLVEAWLLEGIKRELFTPEALELFKREAARLLAERKRQGRPELDRAKSRLAEVQGEIENIMAAIKAGILTETTKVELERAEAERKQLQAALNVDTDKLDKVAEFLPRAVDRYRGLVGDLENIPPRHVARARAQIKALVGG